MDRSLCTESVYVEVVFVVIKVKCPQMTNKHLFQTEISPHLNSNVKYLVLLEICA